MKRYGGISEDVKREKFLLFIFQFFFIIWGPAYAFYALYDYENRKFPNLSK